ncbi:T9SS type A sorting domain-containing protein [Hymenobacter persicinus]|uniref:T9SS type A sorting domain-containing protein n=1 Tax=Hymenobacter persicinus TaxID=2025506 RepID=A0A4Q5LI02_9BACT|nr:T9SS type A sorting domain-containing protein [Hymenobacter persicinus]RYU82157.1 T9SS type A sorting domain-containing protein [Hymenobacter persicinus]
MCLATPLPGRAQYQTAVQDGVITASEYGNTQNQVTNDCTWYMTWDANYLYVAISGNRMTLPAVVFFDTDPALPVNTSAGTGAGITFSSDAQQANVTPPFQADRAFFFDNEKVYYYTVSAGAWTSPATIMSTTPNPPLAPAIADLVTKTTGNTSVRELRIARSALNLSATAPFNWLGYLLFTPSGNYRTTDGSVPTSNEGGYLASSTAARYAPYYYTVSSSGSGTDATKPFSQTSFMAPSTTAPGGLSMDIGSFSTYDFALNSPGVTVRNTGSWTINGTMMIQQGTLDMNSSSSNVTVKRDFMVGSGGTFKHSTSNSNLAISGNMSVAGTFVPGEARVTLDGTGAQQLAGGTYYDLFIPGTGTKTITGDVTVLSSLNLSGGLLETGGSKVILAALSSVPGNIVLRETGMGYVRGTVQATGNVTGPNNYQFGGIGLTLTPSVNSRMLGTTTVTRYTGAYKTGAAFGVASNALSQSALRQFLVQSTATTNLNYKVIFEYHDTAPSELSYSYLDNSVLKTYTLDENTLELFRTTVPNSGIWQNLHATSRDANGNSITVTGITEFTNGTFFTLADKARPLPVSLTKFTAQVVPAGVQLTWATATELLNKGFAVERRTALNENWQELTFVVAKGSGTQGATYAYLDAGVSPGTWYYRLRQRDTDGAETLLPATAIKVGEASSVALQASPVPAHDQLTLTGLLPGQPLLIFDAVGRRVLQLTPEAAALQLSVANLSPGFYTARVLNGRQPLTVHFVKE